MEQLSWRYTVRENVVVFCCKVENVDVAVFLLQSRPGQVQFDSNKQMLHLAQPKLLTKVVFKSSSFLMLLLDEIITWLNSIETIPMRQVAKLK